MNGASSEFDPGGVSRRTALQAALGLGVATDVDTPSISASVGEARSGLVSILDFVPVDRHAAILNRSARDDHTSFVQAAFDSGARLWAPAEARFNVRMVTITGQGRFFDLNNAQFVGIADRSTPSIVRLQCGHSEIRGLRVAGAFNPNYHAGVHHFTDDALARPIGYNRFLGGQVDGVETGLLIGTLYDDRRRLSLRSVDAPVSEGSFVQWQITSCIRGLVIDQPNGKLHFLGCHLAGETADWRDSAVDRATGAAIVLRNGGSEVIVIGGTVEQLQEHSGSFVEVHDGNLIIDGAVIETRRPSYLAGAGRLSFSRVANGGFNSADRAFVEVQSGASGLLRLEGFRLVLPSDNHRRGSAPLVIGVASFGGRAQSAPRCMVTLSDMELRDVRWSGGGDAMVSLARGVPVRINQSALVNFALDGMNRLLRVTIDDGPDLLAGVVDRAAATLPIFPDTASRAVGGWQAEVGAGGRWGRVSEVGSSSSALRLSAAASGRMSIQSSAIALDRDRAVLLRVTLQRLSSVGRLTLTMIWLDFSGRSLGETAFYAGALGASDLDDTATPVTLWAQPPAGAERGRLSIAVSDGADLVIGDPSLK